MCERFDYQRQQDDDRCQQEDEQWQEALRLNRLIDEHREWKKQFFKEKRNA